MILEVIVSTIDASGRINLAPMGISWEGERLLVRPFRDSATFRNLTLNGQGVANFTDNVLVFARCAVGEAEFATLPARRVRGVVLADTCHWREFEVESADRNQDRACFLCRVVAEGRVRDFSGLNRTKHAVIEAAIAASRIPWLGGVVVLRQVEALAPLVEKTAGPQELEAYAFLRSYVAAAGASQAGAGAQAVPAAGAEPEAEAGAPPGAPRRGAGS